MKYSFIDLGKKDFLRNSFTDLVLEIEVECFEEAEDWLLKNGEYFGWTNSGVKYINWDEKY
jgi:hypothetical protein